MDENKKAMWIKRVLVFNMIVAILIWGLPLWIGPKTILTALKITVPSDLFYMRIFGAIQLGFAYLLWLAYENPVMNRDIIRFNVVENAIVLITIVGYQLAFRIKDSLVWFSALFVLFFGAAYYLLTPPSNS